MTHRVRVWDLPTRVFHWALAACVIALVVTGQIGGSAMDWHFRLGYAVLTLLLFRLAWGLVGGHWSRFSSFLYAPSTLLRYLCGQGGPELSTGHNPLGAGSVFALLFFLLAQVATGLISDDEIATSGPLTSLVPSTWVSQATWYHHSVGKLVLIVLVALHVAAILFYLLRKRQNLVRPMLLGDKEVEQALPSSLDDARTRLLAIVLLAVCAGLVSLLLKLAPAGY
ncbi:MAG: cytochrome b/b6 domain-containing protein [Hylemonella sp.]|nr:cytochrome b/b6 domain-containing protein [Hylemonella sp.]MDP1936240.1 cytochrome b/b6 domain-containing protein [Hylemonella sp.]